MPADEQLRADLADFTVRLAARIERIEAEAEEARRLALDALDAVGDVMADRVAQLDERRR